LKKIQVEQGSRIADQKVPGEQPLKRRGAPSRPVFDQATLDAIELVGNVDAQNIIDNGTFPGYENEPKIATLKVRVVGKENLTKRQGANPNGWWPSNVDHTGHMAFGGNSSYKVYKMIRSLPWAYKRNGDCSTRLQ
jgi:hypothetical protein